MAGPQELARWQSQWPRVRPEATVGLVVEPGGGARLGETRTASPRGGGELWPRLPAPQSPCTPVSLHPNHPVPVSLHPHLPASPAGGNQAPRLGVRAEQPGPAHPGLGRLIRGVRPVAILASSARGAWCKFRELPRLADRPRQADRFVGEATVVGADVCGGRVGGSGPEPWFCLSLAA